MKRVCIYDKKKESAYMNVALLLLTVQVALSAGWGWNATCISLSLFDPLLFHAHQLPQNTSQLFGEKIYTLFLAGGF